ncbi:phosphatase PAP2 family protein [Nitrospira defluvii]|uniref:AcidPPc domain-containing protein n=1 Tax=Nitrospira defluvii TaxID=330214 RepID=A0ABM8QVK0_9BACT|nr:phosphatase PAP2 family protein [Nitrospira defluvii]CAE6717702.1 acidPPc domain-containing protein [Nitrospira defluvii]
MIGSGDGQVASAPAQPEPAPDCPSVPAVIFSVLVLLGSFAALFQIDIPILRFLRSHNLSALQSFGDLGEKLGNGGTLITISLLLLGAGFWLKRQAWMQIALDSLLAHGMVAIVVNSLKHIIGRPRPRLTHSGGWHWWPSLESGLDSFPSGHTSATVAVVTVLARALPRLRWVPFALATWVGASRIWRGSHFPGDVVGGVALGFVVGSVCNEPLREWRQSGSRALVRIAPIVLLLTGLFWVLTHRVVDPVMDTVFLVVGLVLLGSGWLVRTGWGLLARRAAAGDRGTGSNALILFGLGVATGAPVVIGLTALLCVAQWIAATGVPACESAAGRSWRADGVYALGLLAAVVAVQLLKGLVPLH